MGFEDDDDDEDDEDEEDPRNGNVEDSLPQSDSRTLLDLESLDRWEQTTDFGEHWIKRGRFRVSRV